MEVEAHSQQAIQGHQDKAEKSMKELVSGALNEKFTAVETVEWGEGCELNSVC